ncbi:hypothetical protein [Streptomyces sp. NPDC047706]|uniref:hypothetical protein n=1 Tax=Streptomyces sp. NPDC047706 TaxID=3365486 RepID=UPI00371F73F1
MARTPGATATARRAQAGLVTSLIYDISTQPYREKVTTGESASSATVSGTTSSVAT